MSHWIDRTAIASLGGATTCLYGLDGLLAVLGLAATLFLFGWAAYGMIRGLVEFMR